jgi:hypothetical protein
MEDGCLVVTFDPVGRTQQFEHSPAIVPNANPGADFAQFSRLLKKRDLDIGQG